MIPPEITDSWRHAQQTNEVMLIRQGWAPPGEFEGILQSDRLKHEISHRFGPEYIWSASRLNSYANCPYGFFAQTVLKMEPRQDPEEGLNAMQRGSLVHAVLERLFDTLILEEVVLDEPNKAKVLTYLDSTCEEIFPTSPQKYGFRPGALWYYEREEIRRQLRSLISWECQENGQEARYLPFLKEARFGFGKDPQDALQVLSGDKSFRLHGVIDRVDRDSSGNLRVIDYKSGSAQISKPDTEKGLALQTALYALAAQKYWTAQDARVKESTFLSVPQRKFYAKIDFDSRVEDNDTYKTASDQAAWNILRVRDGKFPSSPGKPTEWGRSCRRNCEFINLCRVNRQSIFKAGKQD